MDDLQKPEEKETDEKKEEIDLKTIFQQFQEMRKLIEEQSKKIEEQKTQLEEYKPRPIRYVEVEPAKKEFISPDLAVREIYKDVNKKYETYREPKISLKEEGIRIARNMGVPDNRIAEDILEGKTGLPEEFATYLTMSRIK